MTKRSRSRTQAAAPLIVFRNISELFTFDGFAHKDGRAVTESDYGIIKNAAMVCQNGLVTAVGSEKAVLKALGRQKHKTVDLRKQIVIPAFTECHTHLVFAGHRAEEFEMRNRGATYQEIAAKGGGILSTMAATRSASPAHLQQLAQARVDAFVEQGVTTVESKTGYALNLKDEIKCLQIMKKLTGARIVPTFLGAHARPPEFPSYEDYLQYLATEVLPEIKKRKLTDRVDIFIEKGFFDSRISKSYLQTARDLAFKITIHADQLSLSGGSELGLEFDAQSIDHVICISDQLIDKCAKSSVTAVLLPYADLFLKCDYPPARQLIDKGARVALATDFNPGSAPSQDLQLVGLLARLEMKMTLPETLSAYTYGASAALGLAQRSGTLAVGKACDFITLATEISELFLSPGRKVAAQVFAEGKQLYAASH